MKENTVVFDLQTKLQAIYCFLQWKIRHHETLHSNSSFASFHSYHSSTLYFSPKIKKNLAPNKRSNFYSQNEENSKTEDCLHVHRIWAKQWPNDHQYWFCSVLTDTQNRTEIGKGWQSVDVNWYLWTPGGGQSLYYFLRQRGIAGTNGISPALLPGKRQLFLTHTIICSSNPFFRSKYLCD
jgi:hypothetical protein